jgi:2-iminobutanoate/2-iminopropanoate deaminase
MLMPGITPVQVPGTKPPVGHYSQAVVHNGLVFVSGQLPVDLQTGGVVPGTIEEQTELVLGNLAKILAEAGSGLDRILQLTIFLARLDDWAAVNTVYARVMGDWRPARAVVPVAQLSHGTAIGVACVAAAGPGSP